MNKNIINFLIDDVSIALRYPRRWLILAQRSLDSLNRRSSLGNLWLGLTALIFVVALSIVYSAVLNVPLATLIPYVAVGYVVWQMLSGLLMVTPNIFLAQTGFIRSKRLPFSLFVFAAVYEKLVIFTWQSVVIILVCFVFQTGIGWAMLILPFSMMIIFVTAVGLGYGIGTAALKYRDIGNLINSMMTVIFLCTPVLWQRDVLGDRGWIADYNPFYHYIEIIRSPILYQEVPVTSFLVSFVGMLASVLFGVLVIARYRGRIVFWL